MDFRSSVMAVSLGCHSVETFLIYVYMPDMPRSKI